ncbi:uncharacterized protein [Ambystoma mexicanum]|uniref:uncharacterized protein n=1 Tax=Ambystoma mexicanum TaxID=8296 RepID=UPI0037E8C712
MLLDRLEAACLTIHKEKCKFFKTEISFFGYKFSSSGISPDPQKVADIQAASLPKTPTDIRSFLGMATLSEPLRELTKLNAKWEWGKACEDAFESIKESLSVETRMA